MPTSKKTNNEEDQFLEDYLSWLKKAGYDLAFHVIDSKKHAKVTSRGFPDVFSSNEVRGILVAELKSTRGQPLESQWKWLTRLARQLPPPPDDTAKGRVHLWKPADRAAALTQMGIPDGQPVECDCPVCRYLAGKPPKSKQHKKAKTQQDNESRCPACGRPMTIAQILGRGTCGQCLPSDLNEHEAKIIAERIMEKVY